MGGTYRVSGYADHVRHRSEPARAQRRAQSQEADPAEGYEAKSMTQGRLRGVRSRRERQAAREAAAGESKPDS